MYKEITSITVHPSVYQNQFPKECSVKFIMRDSALFAQYIENYCIMICEDIDKKLITFAVPPIKVNSLNTKVGDLISIVQAKQSWILRKNLKIKKIDKSLGYRSYTIVTDYKPINCYEYDPNYLNANSAKLNKEDITVPVGFAKLVSDNSAYVNTATSTSISGTMSTKATSSIESEFNEYKDKVNSILNRLNNESKNTTTKKEFNNMKKIFGTYFGKFDTASIAMSIYGMAVKDTTGRHVTYKDGEIMDVSEFIIPNMNYFFAMPTAISEIRVNDIILHQDKPMMCIKGNDDGSIRAIDFTTQEIKDIMPKKNPFGFNFVTKIVCPFGENSFMMEGFGADPSNPFGNMLPMMMLMDGKSGTKDKTDMMMMAMMMSNGTDFTSNPMLMYMMMMKDGGSDIDPMMLMLMMQNKPTDCKCKCKENSRDE